MREDHHHRIVFTTDPTGIFTSYQSAEQIHQEENVVNRCISVDVKEPAPTDPALQAVIRDAAKSFGFATMDLPSEAGQDSQQIAKIAPTGMIFVPCMGGISHSPKEFTPWEGVANGGEVLYRLVLLLDDRMNRN